MQKITLQELKEKGDKAKSLRITIKEHADGYSILAILDGVEHEYHTARGQLKKFRHLATVRGELAAALPKLKAVKLELYINEQ